MKTLALRLLVALFTIRAACGMAMGLSLPEAIEGADIIAHIRVDDDEEVIPRVIRKRSENGMTTFSTNPENPGEYRHVATASLVQVFKGPADQKTITIRHTNGFTCPNVRYEKGAECIVFLSKEKDSGHYVTMGFYNGRFPVKDGQVSGFYLMPGFDYKKDAMLPYDRIAAFLKDAVQKQKNQARNAAGQP